MTDFLWHEVKENEQEEIKKQAKSIMDGFSQKLGKIDSKKLKEPLIERLESEREENKGNPNEIDTLKGTSRDIMFENALFKNKGFIIAEKKTW